MQVEVVDSLPDVVCTDLPFMTLHGLSVGVTKDGMAQDEGEMEPRGLKGATSQSGTRFLKSEAGFQFSIPAEWFQI